MQIQIVPNPVSLSLLIPTLICGVITAYSLRNKSRVAQIFTAAMAATCLWSIAYGLELSCLDLPDMLFFAKIEYLAIPTLPVLWLLIALLYTGREKLVTSYYIAVLFIIPLITIALYQTNHLHYFFYAENTVDVSGPFPMLAITPGTWFWVHLAYSYSCLLLGIVLLGLYIPRVTGVARDQIVFLLIGTIVPVAVNALYTLLDLKLLGHIDLTPFAFTITGLIIARGILSHGLMDLLPTAYKTLIESMDDGIIVLDLQNTVVDSNESARRIFSHGCPLPGIPISRCWDIYPELMNMCQETSSERMEVCLQVKEGQHHYDVSTSIVRDSKGCPTGKVIQFHDITAWKQTEEHLRENEEKYRTFFKTCRDAVFITSCDGKWLDCNDAAAEILGYPDAEELKRYPVAEAYAGTTDRNEFTRLMEKEGFVKDLAVHYKRREGRIIDAMVTAVVIRDGAGKITGYQGTVKDVTNLKQAQDALLNANIRLKQSLESAEQHNREITLLGEMAQWIHASRDLAKAYNSAAIYLSQLFTGDSGFIAEISTDGQIAAIVASFGTEVPSHCFSPAGCRALQEATIHQSDASGEDCRQINGQGGLYICIPLSMHNKPRWLLSIQRDNGEELSPETSLEWFESRRRLLISAGMELALALTNVQLHETLLEQATTDPLTGLYNRRYMEEMANKELHRCCRNKQTIGFIMADLDNFKSYNDQYGHEAGDLMLKSIAGLISSTIRAEDIACRYGGEEFLIILPSATLQDTFARALAIQKAAATLAQNMKDSPSGVTISMGVSAYPQQGESIAHLIAAADKALYRAKNEGRDRVVPAD